MVKSVVISLRIREEDAQKIDALAKYYYLLKEIKEPSRAEFVRYCLNIVATATRLRIERSRYGRR